MFDPAPLGEAAEEERAALIVAQLALGEAQEQLVHVVRGHGARDSIDIGGRHRRRSPAD